MKRSSALTRLNNLRASPGDDLLPGPTPFKRHPASGVVDRALIAMALATNPPIAGSRKRQLGSTISIERGPSQPRVTAVTLGVLIDKKMAGLAELPLTWHRILDAIERLQAKAPAEGEKVH